MFLSILRKNNKKKKNIEKKAKYNQKRVKILIKQKNRDNVT